MLMTILQLVGGMAGLTIGGELLVRGASKLAAAAKLSPLFIGLTVVAIGTSSPELIVSISTSLKGQGDLSLGNVVGSNIFNTLMILGLSAVVSPLIVKRQMIRFDVPCMIVGSLLIPLVAADGWINRPEGIVLLSLLLLYTAAAYFMGRKDSKTTETVAHELDLKPIKPTFRYLLTQVGIIAVGLLLLVFGCEWFVGGAVQIARNVGLSETVIGLTILAAGTSLPELVTSVVATLRNERDIAVGNVIGSNLFNVLGVLGAAAVFSSPGIQVAASMFQRDLPVMVGTALICLPIFASYGVISRWEGLMLLGFYVLYTVYLILSTTGNPLAQQVGQFAIYVALPVALIVLTVTFVRSSRVKSQVT